MKKKNSKFNGQVQIKSLREKGIDKSAQLLAPFSYRDKYGKLWVARKGEKINGASIPKLFWSIIGSPLTGDYREASVINDVYCERKSRPHKRVHQVFTEMLEDLGVPFMKRVAISKAVKWFGPRWKS